MKSFLPFFFPLLLMAKNIPEKGLFTGRIAKLNKKASLVRFYLEFANMKYLNKGDGVELFWEKTPKKRCLGRILGKSNQYILVKVKKYGLCKGKVPLVQGTFLHFYSQDLKKNLEKGKQLIKILLKKHLGIRGQLEKAKKRLGSSLEKVEAINQRYEILSQKLNQEWKTELLYLEEDRSLDLKKVKDLQVRLDKVDFKMEKYRLEDETVRLDRWSLDPKIYSKK